MSLPNKKYNFVQEGTSIWFIDKINENEMRMINVTDSFFINKNKQPKRIKSKNFYISDDGYIYIYQNEKIHDKELENIKKAFTPKEVSKVKGIVSELESIHVNHTEIVDYPDDYGLKFGKIDQQYSLFIFKDKNDKDHVIRNKEEFEDINNVKDVHIVDENIEMLHIKDNKLHYIGMGIVGDYTELKHKYKNKEFKDAVFDINYNTLKKSIIGLTKDNTLLHFGNDKEYKIETMDKDENAVKIFKTRRYDNINSNNYHEYFIETDKGNIIPFRFDEKNNIVYNDKIRKENFANIFDSVTTSIITDKDMHDLGKIHVYDPYESKLKANLIMHIKDPVTIKLIC